MKLVSIFLTLITIFSTANHLRSCASPIVAEDTGDDNQLLNLTAAQAEALAPRDQLCRTPRQWRYRRCVPSYQDRSWADYCFNGLLAHGLTVYGSCPAGTMCMNTLFLRTTPFRTVLARSIFCLARPKTRQEKPALSIAVKAFSGQVGFVPISTYDISSMKPVVSIQV